MFSRKRLTAPSQPAAPPVPAVSQLKPLPASLDLDRIAAYEELAAEIRLKPGFTASNRLVAYMHELELPCWGIGTVNEFLARQAVRSSSVVWHPLRDEDHWVGAQSWGWPLDPEVNGHNRVYTRAETYSQVVPYGALRLVKRIEEKFPQAYDFLVSDYEVSRSERVDPFLKANPRGTPYDHVVIFHWDEPGWGEVEKEGRI